MTDPTAPTRPPQLPRDVEAALALVDPPAEACVGASFASEQHNRAFRTIRAHLAALTAERDALRFAATRARHEGWIRRLLTYCWRFWHWFTRDHAWAKHNEWAHGVEATYEEVK